MHLHVIIIVNFVSLISAANQGAGLRLPLYAIVLLGFGGLLILLVAVVALCVTIYSSKNRQSRKVEPQLPKYL